MREARVSVRRLRGCWPLAVKGSPRSRVPCSLCSRAPGSAVWAEGRDAHGCMRSNGPGTIARGSRVQTACHVKHLRRRQVFAEIAGAYDGRRRIVRSAASTAGKGSGAAA